MKKLLFLASVVVVSACLAQENSNQQGAAYFNIGTYAQEGNVPASAIPAYEVAINDLVNTPWDPSSPKNQLPWNSMEDFNGAQLLESLNIMLEKGQDLVIHLGNTEGLWNRGMATVRGNGLESSEVETSLFILKYGGWSNFFSIMGQVPLECSDQAVFRMKNEKNIAYHFKNNHAGKTRLEFAYCIDDHGIMNNNRCSNDGKKINVKNIFVITK